MIRRRPFHFGFGLAALCGGLLPSFAFGQDLPVLELPTVSAPALTDDRAVPTVDDSLPQLSALPQADDRPVRPIAEGPLHEAFLSPAKDRDPVYVDKAPPNPINERPGVDPPSDKAVWIPGYWEWNPVQKDYVWTTGTWRNPPPGRFWVNGYWKRDEKGWYRVVGFWSDRQTDRIDWRKNGPPAQNPADDPGASPGNDYFYVPGCYSPDGDGVTWKKGYWAKAPAQAGRGSPPSGVRQPEGWTFQEGYWDRVLRGSRHSSSPPHQVQPAAGQNSPEHQPISRVLYRSPRPIWPALWGFRSAQLVLRRLSRVFL